MKITTSQQASPDRAATLGSRHVISRAVAFAAIALIAALAACGSAAPSAPSASHAPAVPAAAPSPAQPDTAAGASAAAAALFELYSAGQYPAVYAQLAPGLRSAVPEATWVAVHQQCSGSAPSHGLAYQVTSPVLASPSTAVVTVSLAGAASAIGSETQTFDYVTGQWLWSPSGADVSAPGNYSGTVSQIVARMTSAGYCGS